MKFGRILSLVAALIAVPTWATTLTLSGNLELEVVDGKAYKAKKTSLFASRAAHVKLSDGDHQLVLRISDLYKDGSSETTYSSAYYVITLNTKGDSTLKLVPVNADRLDDALRFDQNPHFSLTNSKGTAHAFKQAKLEKSGLQLARDLVQELREFNASGNEAAIAARAPMSYSPFGNPAALPQGKGDATMSGQMMRYWFEQADKETREQFLNWAQKAMHSK